MTISPVDYAAIIAAFDDPGSGLLRAVIASPNDDLPRLIYADYLEERGQNKRAEFIRVQCELASKRDADPKCQNRRHVQRAVMIGDPVPISRLIESGTTLDQAMYRIQFVPCQWCYPVLRNLQGELFDWINAAPQRTQENYGKSWWQDFDLDGILPDINWQWIWHRGFIQSIRLSAEDWYEFADAIRRSQPIQVVNFSSQPSTPRNYLSATPYWQIRWPGIEFTLP